MADPPSMKVKGAVPASNKPNCDLPPRTDPDRGLQKNGQSDSTDNNLPDGSSEDDDEDIQSDDDSICSPPSIDSNSPEHNPDLAPDELGIYTGPEADAVLARGHAYWHSVLKAAQSAAPGEFPPTALDIKSLLVRVPALPKHLPALDPLERLDIIEGFSTWNNLDLACPLRTVTERPQTLFLCRTAPYTLKISECDSFHHWHGVENNAIALLVLAWSYIFNASFAERRGYTLTVVGSPSNTSDSSDSSDSSNADLTLSQETAYTQVSVDASYMEHDELMWWRLITEQHSITTAQDLEKVLPWSVDLVQSLGIKFYCNDDLVTVPIAPTLPSAVQAAIYLQRFCIALSLGNQYSAALAAVICFKLHGVNLTVPKPYFSSFAILTPPSVAGCKPVPDFAHLDHYMTLALSRNVLIAALESAAWEPDVPCNYAGHWLRPLEKMLVPILKAENYELQAKIFSSTRAAPLWLGTLICGQYKNTMSWFDCHWFTRQSCEAAAWLGTPRSFLSLPPDTTPHLQNGQVSRADVWRLRRDLRDRYDSIEQDVLSREPNVPWRPFGVMRFEDIETELHDHLGCSHHWSYAHWTWAHDETTDRGFRSGNVPLPHTPPRPTVSLELVDKYAGQYRDIEDVKRIMRGSRGSTEWIFKWCGDQLERGFTGHVVPRFHHGEAELSGRPRQHGLDGTLRKKVRDWLKGFPSGRREKPQAPR